MARPGASLPSASSRAAPSVPGFVVIGNPGSRRVELLQEALARLELPAAGVVAWADLLSGQAELSDVVRAGTVVRIESPGRDFEVERALLTAGAEVPDEEECDRLSRQAVRTLEFDRGRILYPRQWYLGFCAALRLVERQLAACPEHRRMSSPAEIAVMFDKRRCHERLLRRGVPVPRSPGAARSFQELVERMRESGLRRVFVKLAHGSSASGAVAYQTDGRRHQAATTVETVREQGELRLYNSRRIRVLSDPREIAELIDALGRHCVHVEQWLPKAGLDGHAFDLRVVVIGGQARHALARLSRSPMTNLHLLNARRDAAAVRAKMAPEAWEAACRACERAMEAFPDSLCAGVDILIAPGFRRHAVLEVNAFGDLLPDLLWEGEDTYTAQVRAALQGDRP